MAKLNSLSPWMTFYHQIEAFFAKDDEVKIVYDENKQSINVYVNNAQKAAALSNLLPAQKTWENITLAITVIPANGILSSSRKDDYTVAFAKNPAVDCIKTVDGLYNNPLTYIIFKKEVVQYFNDSLGDYNGICSTLYENIARDIFEEKEGIFFNTNTVIPPSIIANPWTITSGTVTTSTSNCCCN